MAETKHGKKQSEEQQPEQQAEQRQPEQKQPVVEEQVETQKNEEEKKVSHETNDFDADAYVKSIETKPHEKGVDELKQENSLLKKQNQALIKAYNKQKQAGITIVDNGLQSMREDSQKQVDSMLRKYYQD